MPDEFQSSAPIEPERHIQLPSDIEAEQAVLASCLLSEDACYEITISLKPEQFYRTAHQRIYENVLAMVRDGLRADVISLADKLQASGDLEASGGRSYLADLHGNTFALTNWRHHMEIVKRTAIQRELIRAAAEINALAYNAPDDLNEVVDSAEQTLFNVTEKRVSSSFKKMDSLVDDAYTELSKIASQGDSIVGCPPAFATWTSCSTASAAATWSSLRPARASARRPSRSTSPRTPPRRAWPSRSSPWR